MSYGKLNSACPMLLIVLLAVPAAGAQAASKVASSPAPTPAAVPTEVDRQRALQADADRLAKLAEQLQLSLQHARRDELSVKVVQTADEMDRLARSARTRIR